jgi:hypothetical protein
MKRALILGTAFAGWLACAPVSQAQVFVRAPFVRVYTGDGVYVRAPFVNLYVPGDGPVVYGPRVIYMPPPGVVVQTVPPPVVVQPQPQPQPVPPPPQPVPEAKNAPPPPVQPVQAPTLEAFSKTFQAKAGSYDVTLINPITKAPTPVRFSLPEGTPRRVIVTRDSIEWVYALRQWVRIEFDKGGATVISR